MKSKIVKIQEQLWQECRRIIKAIKVGYKQYEQMLENFKESEVTTNENPRKSCDKDK